MKRSIGFTLIELLIVVAIIAILAAIAVPNFLEAQTRAKVSRAKADQRTFATAMESFCIDKNWYPPDGFPWNDGVYSSDPTKGCSWVAGEIVAKSWFAAWPDKSCNGYNFWRTDNMIFITTPIAYLTSAALHDPFSEKDPSAWWKGSMVYVNYMDRNKYYLIEKWPQPIERVPNVDGIRFPRWEIDSIGPDGVKDNAPVGTPVNQLGNRPATIYDPTNGTISFGNIVRCQ